MSSTVLVIDDEKNIRRSLGMVLRGAGLRAVEAASAEEGLALLEQEDPDLVILDVRLPGMSGIEALKQVRETPACSTVPVLVISGHATVADAVEAVRIGATDFLEKPLDRDRLLVSVHNALTTSRLRQEVDRLKADALQRYEMIGDSSAMQRLYAEIEKVAPTRGRVLITGESGTGKELVARAIHRLSPRNAAPFIKVNCAAIPTELIESELFGHERGAFTGASDRKKGLFEQADGGTLLLDEVGDMSLEAQAKVLRALQSGEVSRVGSERTMTVDVRVLAATNKDLQRAIQEGGFREDLFFRLNVVPLYSPSLRERMGDIPALALTFAQDFARENGLRVKPIDADAIAALGALSWPGNVRELRNVVERMVILSGDRITATDVPETGGWQTRNQAMAPPPTAASKASASGPSAGRDTPELSETGERLSLKVFREQAESRYILQTLEECDWNISRAAGLLGVERTNLHKKMRSLGIQRDTQRSG